MAEKNENQESTWWDWAMNAKEQVVNQSTEVMGFVKKDIDEFAKVFTQEARAAVSTTASAFKEKLQLDDNASQMKQSMSGFFNHVAEVFTPPPDDGDVEAIMICNQQPVFLDRNEAAEYLLCTNNSNFLNDPEGEEKSYDEWLHSFNIEDHQHELSDLLLNNEPLQQTYTALVPSQVNHVVFWHRYYYKMEKIKEAKVKREEMKLRMESSTKEEDDQSLWDEEPECVKISEEVQKDLLAEYEKECHKKGGSRLPDFVSLTPEESIENLHENHFTGDKTGSCSPTSSKDTEESWEKVQAVESDQQGSLSPDKTKNDDWETWT